MGRQEVGACIVGALVGGLSVFAFHSLAAVGICLAVTAFGVWMMTPTPPRDGVDQPVSPEQQSPTQSAGLMRVQSKLR